MKPHSYKTPPLGKGKKCPVPLGIIDAFRKQAAAEGKSQAEFARVVAEQRAFHDARLKREAEREEWRKAQA